MILSRRQVTEFSSSGLKRSLAQPQGLTPLKINCLAGRTLRVREGDLLRSTKSLKPEVLSRRKKGMGKKYPPHETLDSKV
ncbi:Hypothetical protein FKW44_025385 [Caligus rogercresseyi]|uniref:Uncharacterized protein n=1 Tax=Caligus rogercresseyi TaxID=217165 RepID=A0A7T8GL96_CALRO|nr:Hypothetical protein FKW44_025385 [Caligus rogercresseyi]